MALKEQAINGVVWNGIDKLASQGIQFVIGLILARMLLPSDYGLLGMIAIFTAIAYEFVNSGLSNALIRKNDRSEVDFSTVFYFNIGVSVLCYLILFFVAPYVAEFYNQPILTQIIRVVSLNIVISALSAIQRTIMLIDINFRVLARVNVLSVIFGGVVGVWMVFNGFGVWSLVAQMIAASVASSVALWIFGSWSPILVFSRSSFKELFGYSSKLLGANLINTIFTNGYYIVIGNFFSATQLGYYTRAQGFSNLPSYTITTLVQGVTFPVLSKMQNEPARLESAYRQIIKLTAFVVFPLMILLACVANPLIICTLTEKWAGAVILLQMLCFAQMWYPIHAVNLNILYVVGRSDLFLRLELIKKVVLVLLILLTFSFGVVGLVAGQVVLSLISLYINTYYAGKFITYTLSEQLKDLLPILCLSVVSGTISYFAMWITDIAILKICIASLIMATIYLLGAYALKFKELEEIYGIAKNILCRNKSRNDG